MDQENYDKIIKSNEDLLKMLDAMFRDPAPFWNKFFSDRIKEIPFFVEFPDENLVSYFHKGFLTKGKVLEFGCGNGRNAIFFAQQGCTVDAIDISNVSIEWGKELALKYKANINFTCKSVYDLDLAINTYDIIYDSGCLHHITPHRRIGYINLIKKALKPGGYFGLTCFRPGFIELGGGKSFTDLEVYKMGSLKGGLAYSENQIRLLFEDQFEVVEFRPMQETNAEDNLFGKSFLWAVLCKKKK
ncbi:Tellurite methyltransferase [Sporomusa ovata DSM 2662]|uniref:Methyltransferase n=1 Tax=Sporomusa ovata TaxID=2378 RepID=A0A0U1L1F5_9FIRM|nr:methyltransferase domain-containing protein [Sporomusa ovata]EQB24579.1 methyltransferase type 11 [Sporomusa ovata DSM 2662]CQR73520.1 Methyltransferase [Sporomusa ovata]